MGLLTESKIRELLKKTNLKQSRELVIEKNTIITPSAKSYLKEKRIKLIADEYSIQTPVKVNQDNKERLQMEESFNPSLLIISSKLDKLIVKATIMQKECLDEVDLFNQLSRLIDMLKQLKQLVLNNGEVIINTNQRDSFYANYSNLLDQIDRNAYPTYMDSDLSLRFFELYINVRTGIYEIIAREERYLNHNWKIWFQWLVDTCLVVYQIEKSRGGI
ncbi:hypothetical protein [Fundicoccus culcitae]|uniref:Ethanolamine utilization cobalamin adenosyltransferase n=1 Tax=Fundicoccus culcitae TaxID=2969821 RepID=A0ABY5P3M8_9LACT|nr:hypothetical protein [Fundicoccus culcitae]UUX33332.1 hypothetical protein NRE15_10530 [Fundicoccus culcitae]